MKLSQPRRRRARFGLWLLLALPLFVLSLLLAALYVTHRPLAAPDWVVSRLEARANAALAGALEVHLRGGAELIVTDTWVPRLRFLNVEVARDGGQPLAVLPEARLVLARDALLHGRVQVQTLRINGASLALHRLADGSLDLALGGAIALSGARVENLAQALASFKEVLATPALAALQRVEADGLQIRLDDARLDRVWQVSAGKLTLTQDASRIAVTLGFDVGEADRMPSSVALSMSTRRASAEASFGAAVTAVPARVLALQSPALAWLAVLDAPISGSLRSGIGADGTIGQMDARLEIGSGALSPVAGAAPVALRGGSLHFTYDPAAARVTFSELSFDSRALRLRATGSAQLRNLVAGLPTELLGQVSVSNLRVAPEGVFETPAQFVAGAADLRLRLDPFTLDIGQIQLLDGNQRISASGQVVASAAGWRVALDMGIGRITHDKLLALWPVAVVPRSRDWVATNVTTGELRDVKAALRLTPGEEPTLALGYAFEGAEVWVLRTLPPVRDGAGFATIEGNVHALTVERGHVLAPAGGRIDVSGTVMVVPDIRMRPAPAEVRLRTASSISAALSLLDQPPFEFMTKAGLGTNLADGSAEAETVLKLKLVAQLEPEDVTYSVDAKLTDVSSETIVPGRLLQAPELALSADNAGMQISGKGTLSGVPFDATWSQTFGAENRGISGIEAEVQLTRQSLDAFNISLPGGTVSGLGWGHLSLDLVHDEPIRFRLASDLAGIGLAIPAVNWRKTASSLGQLSVSGYLGDPPGIDTLEITAPGLSAKGSVALAAGGGLQSADFPTVSLGGWFEGPVRLLGQGAGRAISVEITGGRADLRRASFGRSGPEGAGTGGGADGGPVRIALDRLAVTDDIALTGFQGEFSQSGGFSGQFSAKVNGAAVVTGTVEPGAEGWSAINIASQDAGGVLAAAGIFARARSGTLNMTLRPGASGPGYYDGSTEMRNVNVVDAPVLAALLSAASGIGLLEQLNGDGLVFTNVEGAFRLTPELVEITRGAAVGLSLGVSLAGVYNPETDVVDMQGVVSPLYLINGIGELFSRRGEGLIGINYRLGGTSSVPQITVNPLSMLTPGFLRDIFRRPAPTADR